MSVAELSMVAVDSSTIESYSWDFPKKSTGTLFIKFKNGSLYQYSSVPAEVVDNFVSAESKGKYFASSIRNKFVTTKL